ncbi:ribonuclease E inhibitor RraB [Thalassotalea piscium]|uniref:Regulator of RNase E activity RraB n=1 Tax=Thalassotalea piscium TaxID=1230533 RepID=A0A7X0NHR5_9GAMM|nr:ribonuclease E inhibitor RraB [Thalassotalea piscium]MBB6543684.1 regulator of RNase E activity RraB [Thalassotalea piscium]
MNFPNDETGQVLAEMQAEGIDFTIVHKVVFFQLFERKEDAQAMVAHLAEKTPDMAVTIQPDQSPNVWDVDCTVTMLLDYDAIIAQEAEFEQLAAKFKGYNDGWGVEV